MQKLKWRVSFKNEMPVTWTIWHLYKVRKIPARSSSRARFFNLAQAVWCISSNNEGGKKVSVFGMKPFKSSLGLGIKLTGAFSVFWDSGRKTTSLMNFLEKQIMKQMWCWSVYTWSSEERKETKISFTNSPICQKHEHRVFPLIPSPHMLALLDLPDLSSVAYTLKNWPNEMAFLV